MITSFRNLKIVIVNTGAFYSDPGQYLFYNFTIFSTKDDVLKARVAFALFSLH